MDGTVSTALRSQTKLPGGSTKSLFYCYGCGRGGDVIRFAELYHQVKFPQALVLLHPMAWPGAVITPMTFHLSADTYGLNQLRYDLRKLKGHGLLERDDSRYAYRLTAKGVQVALLFLFFHKQLCGPLANSRFHHQPNPSHRPDSKLETAYHKADKAIQQIVDLLAAA